MRKKQPSQQAYARQDRGQFGSWGYDPSMEEVVETLFIDAVSVVLFESGRLILVLFWLSASSIDGRGIIVLWRGITKKRSQQLGAKCSRSGDR